MFNIKEKNINAIDENLTPFDRYSLNKRYRKLARESKNNEVDNKQDQLRYEREKLHRQQKLDRLTDKEKEVSKELSVEKRQSRLDRLLHLKISGQRMNLLAKFFTAVSAITSMLGLGTSCTGLNIQELIISWTELKNLQYFFIGILFFIGELFCGWLFGQTDTINEFFKTNQIVNKCMAIGILVYSALVYITSIYSNGVFWWCLTKSTLVTLIYSFLFDVGGLVCCYYGYKYSNLDSEKIQNDSEKNNQNNNKNNESKTGHENLSNDEKKQVKNESNCNESKTGHTVENRDNGTIQKTGQNESKTGHTKEVKTGQKKSNLQRSSSAKMTFEKMQKLINELDENTIIKPRLVGMTGNGNYKRWIKQCENVEHTNGEWVKKTTSKNVVALTKE